MKKFFTRYFTFIISILIILSLVIIYYVHPPFEDFVDRTYRVLLSQDREFTRSYFEGFGVWGPLAIIFIITLQMFLIVFPSWLPIIVAVMAYGIFWGVLISLIGVSVASTVGYFIGKSLKGPVLEKMIGEKKLEKMDFWISNYAFGSVVLFRVSPFLSNDAISFIAGMLEMKYKQFMIATLTGMTPLAIAIAFFSEDFETLENGLYWIGGGGLILYAVYVYIDYKKSKKNKH